MSKLSSMPQFNLKQSGYVLIITLILLVMLTTLALTQVSLNSTQTRIAANVTDSEISFEKAESAGNEAINKLFNSNLTATNFLNNANGLYLYDQTAAPKWTTVNWSSTSVINSFQGNSGQKSNYIIEQLPSVITPGQNLKFPVYVFRITSRAAGANGNSAVLIQTTLQIPQ